MMILDHISTLITKNNIKTSFHDIVARPHRNVLWSESGQEILVPRQVE